MSHRHWSNFFQFIFLTFHRSNFNLEKLFLDLFRWLSIKFYIFFKKIHQFNVKISKKIAHLLHVSCRRISPLRVVVFLYFMMAAGEKISWAYSFHNHAMNMTVLCGDVPTLCVCLCGTAIHSLFIIVVVAGVCAAYA